MKAAESSLCAIKREGLVVISCKGFRLFLLLAPILGGCGSQLDTESEISAGVDPSGLTVYVGRQVGIGRLLMVSAPSPADSAGVCIVQNGQCTPAPMTKVPTSTGARSIFSTEQLPITIGSRVRFIVRDANGVEKIREFSIQAASNVPAGAAGIWKAVMMAGDYQDNGQRVVAWDNARRDLTGLLIRRGFGAQNFRQLSRDPSITQSEPQTRNANAQSLDAAFGSLNLQGDDRCFLFMTSHGSQTEFYIEGDRGISPATFGQILDRHCGQRPTVAVVSACYSGIMINQNTQRNNRIIFTAASANRTSNGCQPGVQYTFFDECLVQGLQNSAVQSFDDLARVTKSCIDRKENPSNASFPQFYIGESMRGTLISGAPQPAQPAGSGTAPSAQQPNPSGLSSPQSPSIGSGSQLAGQEPGGVAGNQISGAKNLRLVGSSGATDLKTVAGASRYLLIDFSQPSCGYCVQFARTLEQQAQLFASGTCKALTLVGRNQLTAWVNAAQAGGARSAAAHSYSLADLSHGGAKGALDGSNSSAPVATPTIMLFDTQTNQLVSPPTAGALSASALQQMLAPYCR
jgi:hypothetical protein